MEDDFPNVYNLKAVSKTLVLLFGSQPGIPWCGFLIVLAGSGVITEEDRKRVVFGNDLKILQTKIF